MTTGHMLHMMLLSQHEAVWLDTGGCSTNSCTHAHTLILAGSWGQVWRSQRRLLAAHRVAVKSHPRFKQPRQLRRLSRLRAVDVVGSEFVWGRATPFCRSFRDVGPIELPATRCAPADLPAVRRTYCAAASGDECDFRVA